ncbi:MAG: tRNA (guanosine(46)-N7)-methyltransferase TrmB [Chlamydiota bacterium]
MEFENLGIPPWKERFPFLIDRLLCVPTFYDDHKKSGIIFLESFFEKRNPIVVEYCSGNGEWIVNRAKLFPEYNWIAVEKRIDRVKKIWKKGKNLPNLFIVLAEADTFNRYYVPDGLISEAYINFPDPWPKKKHAKHRIIQEDFLMELSRVMQKGSKVLFVTDDKDSVGRVSETFLSLPMWESCFPDPYFVTEWSNYGSSYFDSLWRLNGRTIHYMQFQNLAKLSPVSCPS